MLNTFGLQPGRKVKIAVFGFGGLGRGMTRLLPHRPDFELVAVADSQGYCFDAAGLKATTLEGLATPAEYPEAGRRSRS